jgi:hypothetical protein
MTYGALQIDLDAFTTVGIDHDRRTASVGGGNRIRGLLRAAFAVGLDMPMGACRSVRLRGAVLHLATEALDDRLRLLRGLREREDFNPGRCHPKRGKATPAREARRRNDCPHA